jgi:glyoxylase-like metal-dependent hydrolase (beta-lactamase superfamily II)
MLRHERHQYPIGQGFFHSASVDIRGQVFEYVYDCGSENTTVLASEVKRYADRTSSAMDTVFLSHLDSDHVNGLDQLLLLATADTAVLPYLSDAERIMLACDALDKGTLDRDYLALLANPADWLLGRGVRRVIFIVGDEGEDLPPNCRRFLLIVHVSICTMTIRLLDWSVSC